MNSIGKMHEVCAILRHALTCFTCNVRVRRFRGDPAYPHRVHLQSPFREAVLTDDIELFDASMSTSRISVERLFGNVI